MTYDEFIEKLELHFPEIGWYVEKSMFNGEAPRELKVVFSFPPPLQNIEIEDHEYSRTR